MYITRKILADKLSDYLLHHLSLSELVAWAEEVMMEGDFEEKDYDTLKEITGRIGLADVRAFGLTWETCERFLNQLGYIVQVDIKAQV